MQTRLTMPSLYGTRKAYDYQYYLYFLITRLQRHCTEARILLNATLTRANS